MDKLSFSRDLIDWYWKHGWRRTEEYAIPTSGWLKDLYDLEVHIAAIQGARADSRPTMAIWGPSQTGKSTLMSAFIDAQARYVKTEGEDGQGSALHWPGGSPAFFMSPEL